MPLFASILRIPFSIIAPVIVVICATGAYTVHNAMLGIWFVMLLGVVGYIFKKLHYPLAPLVLSARDARVRQAGGLADGVLNEQERAAAERVASIAAGAGRIDNQLRLMAVTRRFASAKT